jgi:sterol desaturase/sphingolipid hydroxylase (fatty acid hydroxylase superfamily)
MDPHSWVGRLPFMDRLRKHHIRHHDRHLMTRYNFNITYPICDHIFGTVYKDSD